MPMDLQESCSGASLGGWERSRDESLTQLLRDLRSLLAWLWLFVRASVSPVMEHGAELSVSNLAHCQRNSTLATLFI